MPDPAVIAAAEAQIAGCGEPESGYRGAAGAKSLADAEYSGTPVSDCERLRHGNNLATSTRFSNRVDSLIAQDRSQLQSPTIC